MFHRNLSLTKNKYNQVETTFLRQQIFNRIKQMIISRFKKKNSKVIYKLMVFIMKRKQIKLTKYKIIIILKTKLIYRVKWEV